MANPLPVAPLSAYLNFAAAAFQKNNQGKHNQRQFFVLCGENRPKIVSGYGKWNVIDRPLRIGATVPTGFDPARLKIEVRFGIWDGRFGYGGWDTRAVAAREVEKNIDDLHWMAGGNAGAGPSPVVYVWSGTRKHQTDLVPRQYWNIPWVIEGGINWGDSWSTLAGSRIYQEADFTLLSYNSIDVPPPGIQTKKAGGFYVTNAATRSAYGIAAADTSFPSAGGIEILARKILADPRNNPCKHSRIRLERRSIFWRMPIGLHVWVSSYQF